MKNAYNTSAYGSFAYVYDIFKEKEVVLLRRTSLFTKLGNTSPSK